jgi:hypothetical protein
MNRRFFAKTVTLSAIGFGFTGFRNKQQFTVDELLGRAEPVLFGEAFLLRKEAATAFLLMQAAAAEAGFSIYSESSYRSYQRQEEIWTGKYDRFTGEGLDPLEAIKKIIEYSTIPGTSRHHWGTEVDIIDENKERPEDPLLEEHFEKGGVYGDLKAWLDENRETYGFYEVYNNVPVRHGFHYEPWHLSYKAISQPMLKEFLELDLKAVLQQKHLIGSEHFTNDFILQYINENMLDINPVLL